MKLSQKQTTDTWSGIHFKNWQNTLSFWSSAVCSPGILWTAMVPLPLKCPTQLTCCAEPCFLTVWQCVWDHIPSSVQPKLVRRLKHLLILSLRNRYLQLIHWLCPRMSGSTTVQPWRLEASWLCLKSSTILHIQTWTYTTFEAKTLNNRCLCNDLAL